MKDPRMIKGLNEGIRISIRVKEVPNKKNRISISSNDQQEWEITSRKMIKRLRNKLVQVAKQVTKLVKQGTKSLAK